MYKFSIWLVFCFILCIACKTAYVPNTVNVPLFDDAGQMRISGDFAGNVQFAASLGRRFGVMANGMWRKDGETSEPVNGKGRFFEVGVGSFSNTSGPLRYEAYIGAGYGHSMTVDNTKTWETNGARFFFQPSLGIHHSIFELAFTPRLVAGKFQKANTTYTTQELIANKLHNIHEPTWFFIEPAITARLGFQWVKLQVQLGKSFKINEDPLAYDDNFSSIGLIFDFGRRYR
jgi:hypothetical protein